MTGERAEAERRGLPFASEVDQRQGEERGDRVVEVVRGLPALREQHVGSGLRVAEELEHGDGVPLRQP